MASQNFVKKLGFGSKGYSQLTSDSNFNPILLTGGSIDISKQHKKIRNITGLDLPILKIGESRSSLKKLEEISQSLIDQKINRLIVIGGGSIIDFAKRIHINLINDNHGYKNELVVLPSRIGSGAESSMTSIMNLHLKKSIEVDSRYMPDTVIYDLDLFDTLSPIDLFVGSLDALTHLIESTNSFLSHAFVDFLAVSSLKRFLDNIDKCDFKTPNKKCLIELCILSFNGGLAQNNAGAGICHSLSHSTEEILNIPHQEAIGIFLKPSILFMSEYYSDSFELFDQEDIKKIIKYTENIENCNLPMDFQKLVSKPKQLKKIIDKAQNDPCWKLMKKRVNKDTLFDYFTEEYEFN